jgi:hypothetical protein
MTPIANNPYYTLEYDPTTNWIHWTMQGTWKSMAVAPKFESDWKEALKLTKRPFKIFSDLSKLIAIPDDVKRANNKMQQKLIQSGCSKVSVIVESAITKLSLNKTLRGTGMESVVQYFDNAEDASAWLARS